MANDITPALLEMARKHFAVYMAVVHMTDSPDIHDGHALAADHHRQIMEMLLSDDRQVLIICPRGAAKTFILQAWCEWQLGKASLSGDKFWARRYRILYLSASASMAEKVSEAMMTTIESNETFQAIFPGVKPHKKRWGKEAWKVLGNPSKDPNFQAAGIDGAALGSRADLIVLDDIGDEKNMATSYQREAVKTRLNNTVMPIRKPGTGRVIMLCTRWAWDDTVQWAEERGFRQLLMKALLGDEETGYTSYWPERFTVEELLIEKRAAPKSFARQYQNEVVPDEGLIFTRDWFEPRFDYLPGEVRWRICSWDTAAGQGRNRSYSAGWSALVTPDFHVYLFRLTRGQVPYPYLREAIKHQANEDKANFVIIEKKSSGHQVIQEYALETHPWRVIEWQPFGQRGSPTRLEANEKISAMCQTGMVHLPSEGFMRKMGASWLPDAEKEIFSYPDGESDDIVDAMCQMLYWVQEQRHAWERRLRNINTEPGRWVTPRTQEWAKTRV